MSSAFEIQGYSIPNTWKEKNGDAYLFEFIESEQLLLAAVADGVSRQPCDWQLHQLTKDDSVVTKEKVFSHGGFRHVDKDTLTKTIGQKNISVDVVAEPISMHEIIILATDGFYEARKASFIKVTEQLEESDNFETNFDRTIGNLEILRGDDFTVVMIIKK